MSQSSVTTLAKNLERLLLVSELEVLASKMKKTLHKGNKREKSKVVAEFLLETPSRRGEDRQQTPSNYVFSISFSGSSAPKITIPDPTKITNPSLKKILNVISTTKNPLVYPGNINNYSFGYPQNISVEVVLQNSDLVSPSVKITQYKNGQYLTILGLTSNIGSPPTVTPSSIPIISNYSGYPNSDFTTWYFDNIIYKGCDTTTKIGGGRIITTKDGNKIVPDSNYPARTCSGWSYINTRVQGRRGLHTVSPVYPGQDCWDEENQRCDYPPGYVPPPSVPPPSVPPPSVYQPPKVKKNRR